MTTNTSIHATPRSPGELCVGGDWAQAHGDYGTLRYIAQQLASGTREPLHCDLVRLADLCLHDLDAAAVLWERLKSDLLGRHAR